MRIHYIVAVFIVFQAVLRASTTPVTVDGIDVQASENTVKLLVKTSAEPSYQVAFSREDQLKLRIDDATGYDFVRSASPLWRQVPFKDISLAQFYNNLYLTIGTENRHNFQFSHRVVNEGIQLTFQSDLFQVTGQDPNENILEATDDNPQRENEVASGINHLETLKNGLKNDNLTQVKSSFNALSESEKLPTYLVKNLAEYFESHGLYKNSEQLWMQYYTARVNSGEVNYSEALPVSRSEHSGTTNQSLLSSEPLGFLAEYKILFALFLVLSLITSGGYVWYSSHHSSQEEKVITPEASTDFLSALQHSMESETDQTTNTHAAQKDNQSDKNSGGKTTETPVNTDPPIQGQTRKKGEKHAGRKRREADRLRRLGLSTDMIARELKLSRGEVELLLKITDENHSKAKPHRIAGDSVTGKTPEEIARQLHISVEEAKIMRMQQGRG